MRRAAAARRRARRSPAPCRSRDASPPQTCAPSCRVATSARSRSKTTSTCAVYAPVVEDGVEVDAGRRSRRRRRRGSRKSTPLVPRAHRVALHEPVRLVARQPRLDEREQQPLAEVQPVARRDVLAHPLLTNDEPLDEPGEAVEHVVDGEERVGQDDPLGRRVRDVALVPERDVLEPDERVGPHDARDPADALGRDRVALVRHRRRALLAAAERLLHLAHLGAGEVADLGREAVERRGEQARARRAAPRAGRAAGSGSSSAPARGRAARRRRARPRARRRRRCRRRPRACRRGGPRSRGRAARGRARGRTPSRRA